MGGKGLTRSSYPQWLFHSSSKTAGVPGLRFDGYLDWDFAQQIMTPLELVRTILPHHQGSKSQEYASGTTEPSRAISEGRRWT